MWWRYLYMKIRSHMKTRNTVREKPKKYNYVYKLFLKFDRRYYYIGKRSTDNEDDSAYLGSGKGLVEYKKKYGKDCFEKEILSYWNTADEALEEEARIVTKELISDEFCLNRIVGGGCFDTTGCIRGKSRPESIKKNSESHKGIKQSEETKAKRAEAIRKKWEDPEYRIRQSEGRMGKYVDHISKIAKDRIGKICIMKGSRWKYIEECLLEEYKKAGWTTRGVEKKPTLDEIEKYKESGFSYSKIGEMYGVGESTVRYWIRNGKLKQ